MSSKRTREDGSEVEDSPHAKVSKGDAPADPFLRKATFKAYLTALNEQFAGWIQEQVSSHVEELWTDGLKDYLEHADKILRDFHDVLAGADKPAPAPAAPAPTKSVSFGGTSTIGSTPLFGAGGVDKPFAAPPAAPGKESPSKPLGGGLFGSANPFSLGGAPSAAAHTSSTTFPSTSLSNPTSTQGAASSAGASSSPATASSFLGLPSSSSAAASGSALAPSSGNMFGQPGAFSFNQPVTNAFGGVGGAFSFGGAAAANGAAPDSTGAGAEEEEEVPQKYESEVVANDEAGAIMYKAKAKMSHYKREDTADGKPTWDSKGVGMIMLRAPKDPSAKPFVTFTTEAGRVLYIANISKSMKMIVNDSSSTLSWSAPWAPVPDQPPTLQMVRFQLGKGKHVELKAAVEKQQEQMAE